MTKPTTDKKLTAKQRKELAALAAMPDSEIDFSDIPKLTEKDWEGATIGRFYKPIKESVTIRLDSDVVHYFKLTNTHYQRAINQALREYMQTHPQRTGDL